ncbi:AUGMIN subunit 5 [Iris pallida]|nr:AUGMIN subunit 5 [Iris pallida]
MDASGFWEQQPLAAREYAARTIIPACTSVADTSNSSKDLIEKELSAFYQSLDNGLYMLPSTPQALLEAMGPNGATGSDALVAAEKNAALLTARAGARDPSAIPSICRVSAALQYPAGAEGSDSGLASVLESLEFCLKPRGSEASILEELSKAINLVHTRRNLVDNDRVLLKHAHRVQQEYERMANYCLKLAADQEKVVTERWLPELRNAVMEAQRCLGDCHRVRNLVDEWWEQPAATAVDWVTVDGQNVGAWLNHVKQLQMAFYDQQLL